MTKKKWIDIENCSWFETEDAVKDVERVPERFGIQKSAYRQKQACNQLQDLFYEAMQNGFVYVVQNSADMMFFFRGLEWSTVLTASANAIRDPGFLNGNTPHVCKFVDLIDMEKVEISLEGLMAYQTG